MFTLTRITTSPNSPMHIVVTKADDSGNAGLAGGGAFDFYPAGSEDGPTQHTVQEFIARAILVDDPETAKHFTCSPKLPAVALSDPDDALDVDGMAGANE